MHALIYIYTSLYVSHIFLEPQVLADLETAADSIAYI